MFNTVLLSDEIYPINLKNITTPPDKLFFTGSLLPTDQKAIAIVGSRENTLYGKKTAQFFAEILSQAGYTLISGLARGIDTIVHKTALKNKGRTIAVLGSGLNVYYPPENKPLYQKISESGAVVSEFPLNTKPLKHNFLQRNRLISGLSLAVVIIEGRRRSGTISTATWAADQGRDVFAVPGPVDSPLSEAPNFLLSQGAIFATTPHDILEYLDE